MTSTIDASETTLPELLQRIEAGDRIVITNGKGTTPVATMESFRPHPLGVAYNPDFELGQAFWEPLPEEELRLWNEGDPNDVLYTGSK